MADITIDIPNEVGQRWTLSGPQGDVASDISGAVVRGVSDGSYTVTWSAVAGYDPGYERVSGPTVVTGSATFSSPTYTPTTTNLTAIWANDGADKVAQTDLRAGAGSVTNHAWDGTKVIVSGARNEVVQFSLYLESGVVDSTNVAVSITAFDERGVGTDTIPNAARTTAQVYEWAGSNIELFYVRYLQIRGLSTISYDGEFYDERHVPERMRRANWQLTGNPVRGTPDPAFAEWDDRPDADEYYPDILVPLEAVPTFTVTAGTVQQVWCDVYVPKTIAAGIYDATVSIVENGGSPINVPVELTVHNFTLPDTSTAAAMLFIGDYNINLRHYNANYPSGNPESVTTRDNYVKLLHRHRFSVVGDERGHLASWNYDTLPTWWEARLNGTLFSALENYDGPGKDTGNQIYSIGQYADWRYPWSADGQTGKPTQSELQTKLSAWNTELNTNHPTVERWVYLADEPTEPRGLWNLANVTGASPAADAFATDGATKNATRDFWIHKDAIGTYAGNAGEVFQSLVATNRIYLQREDDPDGQWAIYELTVDAVDQGDVAFLENCTHIESAGAASFAATEQFRISGGARDVVYFHDVNRWAGWASTTGIRSFCTVAWSKSNKAWGIPNVDHPAHPVLFAHPTDSTDTKAVLAADSNRLQVVYNGLRPLTGSFATEDDGVALVTIPWLQYRLGIDWWFKWETTYFYNYRTAADNDVLDDALTWGVFSSFDASKGETGDTYGNGNGVLVYPGTDLRQPDDNYGLDGPLASIRLKMWRRGIQDVEYIVAAETASPGSTTSIVSAAVPSALWEIGVADLDDPGYQYADISWSTDPEDWQTKRGQLVAIIEA